MLAVVLFSEINAPTPEQILTLFVASILITLAYLVFIKALAKGAVGIIVPLANIYPLLTLLLSVIFMGSIFSGNQMLAMVTIVAGAVVLAYEKNHKKIPARALYRESVLALLPLLCGV